MSSEIEHLRNVPLVLLPVFQALQKAISIRDLKPDPGPVGRIARAPTRNQVQIAIVACEPYHRVQAITKAENHGRVHRIVAFPDVECSAIGLYALNRDGNDHVWICITIPMRVRRQIIWKQKSTNLKKHGDWLAMIARDTWDKILRGFYSTRGG